MASPAELDLTGTATLAPRARTLLRPRPQREHRHLAALLERSAFVFHDLLPAGEPGPSIDHLAVAPSGVWVIASRPASLERVRIRRFGLPAPELHVGTHDRTRVLKALDRQRTLVCGALADLPQLPIHTALSFTGAQFPLLGTLALDGHLILPPTELAARVDAPGSLRRSEMRRVTERLMTRLVG